MGLTNTFMAPTRAGQQDQAAVARPLGRGFFLNSFI